MKRDGSSSMIKNISKSRIDKSKDKKEGKSKEKSKDKKVLAKINL